MKTQHGIIQICNKPTASWFEQRLEFNDDSFQAVQNWFFLLAENTIHQAL